MKIDGTPYSEEEALRMEEIEELHKELSALETAIAEKDDALRVGIETVRRFDVVSGAAFATNPQGSRAYEAVCALRGWANPSFGKAQVALSSEPTVEVVVRADEAMRRETIEECKLAVANALVAGTPPLEALCALVKGGA